ncbi:hypothetical protein ES708_10008 [subsurface metagenome]
MDERYFKGYKGEKSDIKQFRMDERYIKEFNPYLKEAMDYFTKKQYNMALNYYIEALETFNAYHLKRNRRNEEKSDFNSPRWYYDYAYLWLKIGQAYKQLSRLDESKKCFYYAHLKLSQGKMSSKIFHGWDDYHYHVLEYIIIKEDEDLLFNDSKIPDFEIYEIPELVEYFKRRIFKRTRYIPYEGKKKKKVLLELQENEFEKWKNAIENNDFTTICSFYQETYYSIYALLEKFKSGETNIELFLELKHELIFNLNDGLNFLSKKDFSKAFTFLHRSVLIYDSYLLFRYGHYLGSAHTEGFYDIVRRHEYKLKPLIQKFIENIRPTVKELEVVDHYNSFINLFTTAAEKKYYSQAIKNYRQAEVYRKKIPNKNRYIDKKREKILDSLFNLTMSETILHIKKTILDLGTKYSKLSIQEIGEKTDIDLEFLIQKTIKPMIKNQEIYAEYFESTKSIAFNLQANIDEIDKLMEQYRQWEEERINKR